ncbi:MAG: PfkB family carbohydrate kinase [Pyrobaculum sp.]|uniref:Carbohydrate kinase PfkB domain-containing protein n=1 Tax=Pyrobaculum aerophilum TaxID=13773 RepID=A0A832T1J9_9CREN|nr:MULTISPECIES: PfkB family carbohydrate kinase [Pyrobaculum]MCX8136674.1 PfkB family carbohydrate kinase [Pyrobaculum aerophilum]HII46910.1 hypothetical protein [Pyrobaculum aerophilum]
MANQPLNDGQSRPHIIQQLYLAYASVRALGCRSALSTPLTFVLCQVSPQFSCRLFSILIRFSSPTARVLFYKLGRKGAYLFYDGEKYFKPAYDVCVEDPTGAGDAIMSVFVALYFSGVNPQRAFEISTAAATLVITARGDNEAIPNINDAESFLSST